MADMDIDPLNCSFELENDRAVFHFSGTLTIYQTLDIKDTVNKLIEKNIDENLKNIIFDLENLDYLDSYGVSFVIDYHNKFNQMDKNLYIFYGNNNKLKKLFNTIRIGLIIPILEDMNSI